MLVLTIGHGTHAFTLDREMGSFVLTQRDMRVPAATKEFAINMSNQRHWEAPMQDYVRDLLAGETGPRGKNFNMRWIASMVADVHRILTRGGIFIYPWDKKDPSKVGKLRLMYEANPMSLLIEQAGGASTNGRTRIMEMAPTQLHQRVPVFPRFARRKWRRQPSTTWRTMRRGSRPSPDGRVAWTIARRTSSRSFPARWDAATCAGHRRAAARKRCAATGRVGGWCFSGTEGQPATWASVVARVGKPSTRRSMPRCSAGCSLTCAVSASAHRTLDAAAHRADGAARRLTADDLVAARTTRRSRRWPATCLRPGPSNLQWYPPDSGGYPYWHCELYPRDARARRCTGTCCGRCTSTTASKRGETEFLFQQRSIVAAHGRSADRADRVHAYASRQSAARGDKSSPPAGSCSSAPSAYRGVAARGVRRAASSHCARRRAFLR
jgi:hypothetical protein